MKKVIIFIILIVALYLVFTKLLNNNNNSNSGSNNSGGISIPLDDDKFEITAKEEPSLVGIWQMNGYNSSPRDDARVLEASIQFESDGSCVFAQRIQINNSGAVLASKREGTCYLNKAKNKMKMVYEEYDRTREQVYDNFYINSNGMGFSNYSFAKVV